MDYSIHDAIEAGFNKIVFIIRKDIKDAFKEAIGDRIEKICKNLDVEIAYAYQELNELPEGVEHPADENREEQVEKITEDILNKKTGCLKD